MDKKTPSEVYEYVAKIILTFKFIMGVLLILIGVAAAISVLYVLIKIFIDTQNVILIRDLLNSDQNLIDIFATNNATISTSNIIVTFIASFIFLGIGSRLSIKIMELGFKIVDKLDLKYIMERIWYLWKIQKQKHYSNSDFEDSKGNPYK